LQREATHKRLNARPVAIVGAGRVARAVHLPAWNRIKGARVVAVCDISSVTGRRLALDWGIPRAYTDFSEMLDAERDAIIDICTPPSEHEYQSTTAMNRGHDVILEKPMATNHTSARKIIETYERMKSEVRLVLVHNFLFLNDIQKVISLLRQTRTEILTVDIHMLHTVSDEMISNRDHWVHRLPAGRFGENLIHPIYVLRHLLGPLTIRDVYAAKRGPYEWIRNDEVHLALASGDKYGRIHLSFNSPRWTAPFSMTVFCKEFILSFDGSNHTIVRQGRLLEGYAPGLRQQQSKIIWDWVSQAGQILLSGPTLALGRSRVFLGRHSGHENMFRRFIETDQVPYLPEEGYEATSTFLDALEILES